MKFKYILVIAVFAILSVSCKSKKRAVRTSSNTERQARSTDFKEGVSESLDYDKRAVESQLRRNPRLSRRSLIYIATFGRDAVEEMEKYNIPASITLAQGLLESGSGSGRLAMKANNHFGIKCHKSWGGEVIYHDDDALQECFRKYKHPKYSYRDHSLFLSERQRYMFLFNLERSDYKGWARGLKKAGYATDPKYPVKLISLIERYNLTRFDKQVLGVYYKETYKEEKRRESATRQPSHTVVKGDTLYSISRRYNLSVDQLRAINGLEGNAISIGQQLYFKSL
ncbi:MAG: glucosaminidase domain-containing protein [Flavobacteriaceae bacterium]|nr:glucosaminidase domain-containing protein [Flavobacteriaceae bacterium]